jgi:Uma2 family endonuclease
MGIAPNLVSVEEYLNSSWRPDREYVDGVLVERSVPTIAHSLLQALLIEFFSRFRRQFRFLALPEVRTQIIERARYRIPDVLLCPVPVPEGKVIDVVPWAVIEILSPEDSMQEQLERFRDYAGLGVGVIVLLDPERLAAYRFEDDSLIRTRFTELRLPSGQVPFDTESLFGELIAERKAGR